MFFRSKKVLGLDIGSSTIKVAEMDVSGRSITLSNFAMIPTPPQCISQGQVLNPDALASSIQSLVLTIKSKRKNLATGMWGTSVIIKRITMPRVDSKILDEQVRFEAEQYIPFDINGISLTHKVLTTNSNPETMDVLLIAAQNEILFKYVEAISLSQLNCSIVDVNSFALANCFEANYGAMPAETIGLMNFGSETTNFVVIHSGEVIFCRDIGIGGFSFTNEIHKNLGVNIPEAEAFKISAVVGREVPGEVHSIITSETERVVEEIQNSFDFFSASNGDLKIGRFFYSGGSSQMTSMVQQIQKATNIAFETFNPFLNIKINHKKIDRSFVSQLSYFAPTAMGLALREVGDK
jgi:type IV pilus assembly protein PilM